jgi:Cytochrome c
MSWRSNILLAAMVVGTVVLASAASAADYEFGRPATPQEIKLWDIDVRPDGQGLPDGSGTVAHGKSVYADNCEACHGPNGEGGIKDRLVGGQGTLATDAPVKTIGQLLALCHHPVRLHSSGNALPGPRLAQHRRHLRRCRLPAELERNPAS